MEFPVRFVAMTYNLWRHNRWPERKEALRKFLDIFLPDLLCVQELQPELARLIDECWTRHKRVEDPFPGWLNEGNIYWNTDIFYKMNYGIESIGVDDESYRRLFWVRLGTKYSDKTLLVATAHYIFQGTEREKNEGFSPRIKQAKLTIRALERLARRVEAILFMGDLNDSVNAVRILKAGGFQDSFSALNMPLVPTHPAIPTSPWTLPQVIDWQLSKGPIRVMNSNVVDFFHEDLAPSDHKPIVTTYAL